MVWIKVSDTNIINFENVCSIYWKYRDDTVLELYVKRFDGEFLIYNKKVYEEIERLGDFGSDDIVDKNKRELFDRNLQSEEIVKNAIAMDILNKILSHLSKIKKENNDEIINFYKVFGTRKEP